MMEPGKIIEEKYEVLSLIGRGGMSAVYQVRDLKTEDVLALKEVERSSEKEKTVVEQSLATEGKLLKSLSNPHLPRIYDIIENSSSFMLVMDYVPGKSLDRVVAEQGPQPLNLVYEWGMQICEVFNYLHNQNPPVIYRDMKPANVILQPNGHIMMIDFGTARTYKGSGGTQDTVCIGTEGFAAPEQFGGLGESDARTDIFCLGATLYNLVTGHSPYDKPQGIMPLDSWQPGLGKTPIQPIISKCTRPDPNERYQTAMELYDDLQNASLGKFRAKASKLGKGFQWQRPEGSLSGGSGMTSVVSGAIKVDQTASTQPAIDTLHGPVQASSTQTAEQKETEQPQLAVAESAPPWRKLFLISALATIALLLVSVICLAAGAALGGYCFLIFAAAGGTLMAYSLVQMRTQS